jgi:uncharacterized BrkB/YihY/UPF0761 family membrane protein
MSTVWRFVLELHRRAGQLRVGALVASITLRAVTSLVPLLLVGVSVTGLLAQGDADLDDRILDNLKLSDPRVRKFVEDSIRSASGGAGFALAVSIAASLYLGLGVVGALATSFNAAWQVPGRGIFEKLLGIPWIIGAVLVFGLSGFLAARVTSFVTVPYVGVGVALLSAGFTGSVAVWLSYLLLTNVRIPPRAHAPGALLAGALLAVFQIVGAELVQRTLNGRASTYGTFAGIFALFFVFNLFGNILVYGAVVNVVVWEQRRGTTQLVGRAPALPGDRFSELERGGQRPHPVAGSPLTRIGRALLPKRFR